MKEGTVAAGEPGQTERRFYSPVDQDTLEYFKNVEAILDDPERFPEDDGESRELFFNNLLNEIDGKEKLLPMDYDCSRILERIFKLSSDFHIRVFFDKLAGSYVEMSGHRFASHVIQAILTLSVAIVEREAEVTDTTLHDDSDGVLLPMKDLIIRFCDEIESAFMHMSVDPYASHIIRTLLTLLSGTRIVDPSLIRSKSSIKYGASFESDTSSVAAATGGRPLADPVVPASFLERHERFVRHLLDNVTPDRMNDYIFHPQCNPVLQIVLESLYRRKKTLLIEMISAILQFPFQKQTSTPTTANTQLVGQMLQHPIASHLLEKILQVAPSDIYFSIYSTHFRHHLLTLANHSLSNFVVQQLLSSAKEALHAQLLVDEVLSSFRKYLVLGKTGWNVLMKASELSQKFKVSQKEYIKTLFKEFNASDNQRRHLMVKLILVMSSFENYQPENKEYSTFGASLLANLFQFDESVTVPLLESFMSLSAEEILSWSFNPAASRAVEGFLVGRLDARAKLRFIQRLKGHFHELALDKFGGHVVDKCWIVSDIKLKESIAEELLQHERSLKDNFYGKFILRNCRVDQFKRKKEDWMEKETSMEKKKIMFADLIAGDDDEVALDQSTANDEKVKERQSSTAEKAAMLTLGFGTGDKHQESNHKTNKDEKKKKKHRKSDKHKENENDSDEEEINVASILLPNDEEEESLNVTKHEIKNNNSDRKPDNKALATILEAIGAVKGKKKEKKRKIDENTDEPKSKQSKKDKEKIQKSKRQFVS